MVLSSSTTSQRPASPGRYNSIVEGLKEIYRRKIRPVEEQFNFEAFYSPSLSDTEIGAKPMVLLIGQYSVGKTTFIQYLLGRDYPGAHIGPEPTVTTIMMDHNYIL